MVNKDYRKELNLVSPQKMVPRAVAIVVLIVSAAALSFGVVEILKAAKVRHAPKAAPAAAAAATQ
jgi:hypothetical protein